MECVGLAVRGNFPAMRQIRDNRLGAIVRIAPDQIVEHAGCGPKNEDGTGLVNIEMRSTQRHAMAQHAAGFGARLRRLELERRTVKFFRNRRGQGKGGRQPVGAGRHGHAAFQELAAAPPRTEFIWAGHDISPLSLFSRLSYSPALLMTASRSTRAM